MCINKETNKQKTCKELLNPKQLYQRDCQYNLKQIWLRMLKIIRPKGEG
jgi:hypothetical protein